MALEHEDRPYTTYRSGARGLRERLRPDGDSLSSGASGSPGSHRGGSGRPRRGRVTGGGRRRWGPRGPLTWRRGLAYLLGLAVFWLALSFVLFMLSASANSGTLPASTVAALHGGGNMLTATDTVLIIGTDQRPSTTHEAGANTHDAGSRSDTIMLWRIGAGTSRRLSIPRDTATTIPGHGLSKVNAAYAYGGPTLAVQTIERFTGVRIDHLIVVNLAAFPKFIDAIGGVDVATGRICSVISGGPRNGGWELNLQPGTHHLDGIQALVLARTRHNTCRPAESDIQRTQRQQAILNAIKGQLTSPGTFLHLPWAAWQAPKVLRTDMGGPTLLSLFAASTIGGSAPVRVLKPDGAMTLPDGESALVASPARVRADVRQLIGG